MKNLTVIGAGAWGTALAAQAARIGTDTLIYARENDVCESIASRHENEMFLPEVALPTSLRATNNLSAAADHGDALLIVTPAQFVRGTLQSIRQTLSSPKPILLAAKGIEQESLALMSEVAEQEMPDAPLAVISGPSFAKEVAAGLPAAVTLACRDDRLGGELIDALAGPTFRIYRSDDIVGAEVGGSVKNVLAIGCGIVEGRQLGDNARAALITRGLAEMIRLGRAKGAKTETMMGLAGMGDLVLTCSAMQSRNFSFGVALGQGQTADEILGERIAVTEGVTSAVSVTALAHKLGIDMPICEAVNAIIHHGRDIDNTISSLMDRPRTTEF